MAFWLDPERDTPIALQGGSLYGRIRNWVGMEKLAYVIYDDAGMVRGDGRFRNRLHHRREMTRCLETGAQFEGCSMWEDMAYNAGPLISPNHFKKYLVPQYRRITDLLHKYGIDVCWIDCDGTHRLAHAPLAGCGSQLHVSVGDRHLGSRSGQVSQANTARTC